MANTNKRIQKTKPAFIYILFDYMLLFVGCLFLALSFNMLLAPNQIASGGVTGISILVAQVLDIQPAYTQWLLNIPLFILGLLLLGRQFGLRTAVGSMLLPLMIFLTKDLTPLTTVPILASVFGGLGTGLGIGVTFKGKASTGGLSILAQIVHNYSGLSIGRCIMVFDAMVILSSAFVFGAEKAMYALIAIFVTSKAIDVVLAGFKLSKVAIIISDEHELVREAILSELDRGVTNLSGSGGFTNNQKNVLMTAVGQNEVNKLKDLIHLHDPGAFIIIWDTYEVLGEGFHASPEMAKLVQTSSKGGSKT